MKNKEKENIITRERGKLKRKNTTKKKFRTMKKEKKKLTSCHSSFIYTTQVSFINDYLGKELER